MNSLTRVASRTALRFRKNSPQILFVAGIAGSVATVVVSCRATLKAVKVHEEHKEEIAKADANLLMKRYDEDAHRHNVVNIWTVSSVSYAKLYGPAFILGVTSIACLTKSHQILTNRNAAVMAAYAGVDKAFKQYRGKIVEEFGQQKDTELAHGVTEKEIVEYDEKGNPKTKVVKGADNSMQHLYARWFDESNRYWDKDHGYNHTFLDNQQKWANLELKRQGHMFLNEVYDLLGMERTKMGNQVGWVYNTKNPNADGFIDFGFNRYPDFIAGFERSVLLDFNVDGMILDEI